MKVSFIEPLDLPELQPELLDAAGVERFFSAVAFETSVRAVLLRGAGFERGPSEPVTLREARDAFRDGRANGLQVHYLQGPVEWWDTLMRTDAGVRRVRVKKGSDTP